MSLSINKAVVKIKIAINNGAEKVVLNTSALNNPAFIKEASDSFGSSTITVCIDVKKNLFNKYKLFSNNYAEIYDIKKRLLNLLMMQAQ